MKKINSGIWDYKGWKIANTALGYCIFRPGDDEDWEIMVHSLKQAKAYIDDKIKEDQPLSEEVKRLFNERNKT